MREVFGTEFCMVNLVTADTQFFKVWSGELPPEVAAVQQAPRERSMCRHVVEDERPSVVEDFFTTERFREQHLMMGPGIRFYAGAPLQTSEGHTIGSLCLMDGGPRPFDDRDMATLRAFARAVVGRLEALGAAAHERDARESERQYRRNVFELANDAILIYGTDTGLILDANRRACEMYGVPQETLVGMDIGELSLEHEAEEEHTREVLRRGSRRGFETVHRRAGGARMHVSINSSVTEYGDERAILSIVRDVTERKRTEESPYLSERSLAQAQRIAHIGNWEHELKNGRTHWSDEMYRIFGFAPGKLNPSYKTFILFVHPDDRCRVRESIRGVLRGSRSEGVEYRIVRPDGEVRFVHTQYEVALDGSGRPAKFFGTMHDVTDRKQVEQKLKETEERYRLLVERIPAVAYVDSAVVPDAAFYTSPRIEALLGYTPEEWLNGRLWLERLHPEDRDRVLVADTRSRAAQESFGEEYRLIAKDGRVVWVRDESDLLRDEAGSPLCWQGVLLDITERKRAEEALRRSEERFRSLIQNAPDVIMVLDADGTILYDSPSIRRVLGYEAGERIGHNGLEYVHPEDLARARSTFADALDSPGAEVRVEYRLRHKEGSWRHFEATRTNLLDDPAVGGMVINCRDITGRRRAEAALRQSEERYRLVARATNEVIWDNDLTTGKQEWNGAVEAMFGYSPKERGGCGDWWEDRLHPDDRRRVLSSLEAIFEGDGGVWRQEYRFERKDGTYATVVDRGYVVRDEAGKPVRMLGSMMDITERKRTEERLREAEDKYRTLVERIPAVTYVQEASEPAAVSYVSPQMETMLGYAPEECTSDPDHWIKILHPDDRECVLAEDERTNQTGEPFVAEYRQYAKDGREVWVRDEATLVRDAAGEPSYWLGVQTDVTERKRVEEEIREANRRLEELATLRADFTAMVAHELDTPLAVIRGYADVLATGELGHEESGRALAQIQAETEVLNALVEDVRVAASAERRDFVINPREVPVDELLDDAARFVVTLPGDHPLTVEPTVDAARWDGVRAGFADQLLPGEADGGQEVWADRYRIGQVLRNLLANAVKYSPEGAPIGLRAIPGEGPGRMRIEVTDRGPGIHPDDAERIFEKFGRGRSLEGRKVSGVGLGLYLSRRILRAHGSDLTVSAGLEGGSVFGFELEEVVR